jgi:hypothetical protein
MSSENGGGIRRPHEPHDEEFDEPRTCSICDGYGHGYPGAGPCPLEEQGWHEALDDEEREARGW